MEKDKEKERQEFIVIHRNALTADELYELAKHLGVTND